MRLIPRDDVFFSMFASLASRATASARLLAELFANPGRLAELVTAIKQLEHEADTITHDVIARINRTFVTPIDREDIHLLASRLDDVIDQIDGTARRALMFRIDEVREPAIRMTAILIRSGEAIEGAVTHVKKPTIVVQQSVKVKQLEEEGDAVYHAAVGGLFEGTPDPIQVIKWKELYDTIERALDRCEDVANTLESIALKNG
jgi:predicted phosphate transport protein (TIGR00153 family)